MVFVFAPVARADTSFDVEVTKVEEMQGTDLSRFFFKATSVSGAKQISYWKIRLYCEANIVVSVGAFPENSCGKASNIVFSNDGAYITLSNPGKNQIGFSFKLKAYDSTGKWLHSEKKSFRWK